MHGQPSAARRNSIDVGILVGEMDRMLGFYRDLLGLQVVDEATTSLIGKGRMIQLAHGASLVKLIQMEAAPTLHAGGKAVATVAAGLGLRYLTLLVPDIDALMRRIDGTDTPSVIPLTALASGAKIAMVADPEGNIVEFVQEA